MLHLSACDVSMLIEGQDESAVDIREGGRGEGDEKRMYRDGEGAAVRVQGWVGTHRPAFHCIPSLPFDKLNDDLANETTPCERGTLRILGISESRRLLLP
jgi:hypothetical protein